MSPSTEKRTPGAEDPSPKARQARHVQDQLDEALADSFPASDPVAIVTSQTEEDWAQEEPPSPPPP